MNRGRAINGCGICFALAALLIVNRAAAQGPYETTVGMPARIDQLVLRGSELEVRTIDDKTPVIVRMAAAYPHGTDFRYDLVFYGLEAGEFDLKEFLKRKDGSGVDDLPPIQVRIAAILPPGRVPPNDLQAGSPPSLGGYWSTMITLALLWLGGLGAIVWWNVSASRQQRTTESASRHASLGDRLRPIVQDAIAGKASERQLAELERNLLSFWRAKLGLTGVTAVEAIAALRQHEEAGLLLEQLEAWLHRPGTTEDVDITRLLEPYQDLPADVLEPAAARTEE